MYYVCLPWDIYLYIGDNVSVLLNLIDSSIYNDTISKVDKINKCIYLKAGTCRIKSTGTEADVIKGYINKNLYTEASQELHKMKMNWKYKVEICHATFNL